MGWFGARRTSAVATMTMGLLLAAGPAHAWYVDISITGAGRVYETTDANELDEHCPDTIEGFASPGNTPTGTLGATCRAGDAAGDYGHGWVVRYVAEPAAGYRFAGWRSDGRTNPSPVLCDGSNGSSSYGGAACQFATFQNLQTRAVFIDDTPPAMSSLTGPTSQVNGPATFTFSASADPTFRLFECRLVTGGEALLRDWQTCSSGRQEDPAPAGSEGTYKFYVRAVDHSNNTSPSSAVTWTADKLAPETTITAGPAGAVASTSATFGFSGSTDVVGYTCTLDGVAASCQSPKSYAGLGQGPHTFAVQALDDAGNRDGSPDTRTWTVDTVPAETTITDGPAHGSTSPSQTATFSFSSPASDVGAYSCRLDDQAINTQCVSPMTYNGLGDGQHTFRVWARDQLGNTDTSPELRTWTVDTTAPETTIASGPDEGSTSASQTASFSFTGTESATFECQLDGSVWADCVSPRSLSGLAEGEHTFAVRARDAVGNIDGSPATRTWTVDLADPVAVPPPPTTTTGPSTAGTLATMDVRSRLRYRVSHGRTTVRSLKLTRLPQAATVRISCKGKGCAFSAKRLKPSTSSVTLTKLFKNKKLSAGTVIKMRVAASGYRPTDFRYKTRRGSKAPIGGEVATRSSVHHSVLLETSPNSGDSWPRSVPD